MAADVVANRIHAALSHRSWAVAAGARCHLFLLSGGRAALTREGGTETDITAPAMLWLPRLPVGTLRLMAGGEGFTASISRDLVPRVTSAFGLSGPMRPMLDQVVLAGPDMVAPCLGVLTATFAALVDEARGARPAAEAMASLHLASLLLQLWRRAGPAAAAGRRGGAPTTAQRFRQLVELHYREGLSIDEFALRLGVTRAHLHDACLRATGDTPLRVLHERLMGEARARLAQTDLSVEQVGYGLGFRDPAYFNRFFKRRAGQSPGLYRRGARAGRRAASPPSFAAWP
jgi:AraC family transcriptional activator of pobA